MTAISISKKLLKIIAIAAGFIVGILLIFHFWFVSHAEDLLAELVTEQSKGKLKLQVEKFSFNWLKKKMELRKAVFYTTNDSTAPNGYRIEVDRLQLRLEELYPIIAEKRFLIDSLKLVNPVITVTSLRVPEKDGDTTKENLSIPQEMGRVYNSIRDAMKVLQVDRFQIDNGRFSMVNKIDPSGNEQPVTISNIYFHLDNLRVDSAQNFAQQKILFSDNVALQTTKQDIYFPDGRHRLQFSNFRINLQHRLAEFDSCTITATKGDNSNTSFTVFFDKLKMTNIDFDTLYHSEVIKADSVYCINPRFTLNVNLKDDAPSVRPPKLDELVQQLTGDLQLKCVIVENGSFDINTMRKGRPSSFVSDHNNFEMQGLRIDQKAAKPITVQRFAMAIRNYENFVRDSAFSIQFDSIVLNNNRISLGNFAYKEYKNGSTSNRVAMPQFELYGLSWDDLVFSKRLKAEQVVLYKPIINYDLSRGNADEPGDVFKALQEVNKLLQLHNLSIINGEVNLNFRNNAKLHFDNVTSFVKAEQLVRSSNLTGIQRSVNMLMFKKGTFAMGGLKAELSNVALSGSGNQLQVGDMTITKKGELALRAKNISMLSLMVNEKSGKLFVSGVKWNEAQVDLSTTSAPGNQLPGTLVITDIKGSKTRINIHSFNNDITLFIESLSAKEFSTTGKNWKLDGFAAAGNDLTRKDQHSMLSISRFKLADGQPSFLENIKYTQNSLHDSAMIQIPSVTLVADLPSLINGNFKVASLTVTRPLLNVYMKRSAEEADAEQKADWPLINVGKLRIQQPSLYVSKQTEKGTTRMEWKGAAHNFLELEQLHTDNNEGPGFKADRLSFSLDRFLFHNEKGKTFDTREGQLSALIEKIAFRKNEAGTWDWRGKLAKLTAQNFILDSLDKTGGKLMINSARLNDLSISSSLLLNLYELVKQNTSFTLKEITGSYQNKVNRFEWHNISFDKNTRNLSLDSFLYRPVQSQADFIKTHPYQIDYAIVKTGAVKIQGMDMERFLKDTILDLRSITVDNAWADDFRDKRVPRQPGVVRPLPVNHLKQFPVNLSVDSLILNNAWVKYGEYNEKTEAAGWVHVTRLNGLVTHIRNYGARAEDSLSITASAYLEDSVFTALQVKGSYTDTMGGFVMKVQMGPADLRVMNDALGPLAGATLKSGFLDTLTMQVTGKDYMAYGEMTMLYHDLKVMLTGKSNKEKKSFFRGAVNSLVNTILRNKNTDRKGTVFFIRFQDRSPINYLVKITLSGVGSSVGLGKNKRQLRRYIRRNR